MIRSVVLSLVLIILSGIPNAQSQVGRGTVHFLPSHPTPPIFSFAAQEGVELLLTLRPKPGNATPSDTVLIWRITLKAPSGEVIGSAAVEAAIGGLAAFEITVDETSRSQQAETGIVQIVMNGQILGATDVRNGRVVLRAEVERAATGRNPLTGEVVNVPAKNFGVPIVLTVFDFATKATRAVGQDDWTTLEIPGLTTSE